MAPNRLLSAMVTPVMLWSFSTGRLITASQTLGEVVRDILLPVFAVDRQIVFVAQYIVAKAAEFPAPFPDLKAGAFEVCIEAGPR